MADRTLLFTRHPQDLATIGRALRDAGFTVFPARFHEDGADALVRTAPQLVLIDFAHYGAIVSSQFRAVAGELGARVLIFARADGYGDTAALQRLQQVPYPVLEYTGDARALAGLVTDAGVDAV